MQKYLHICKKSSNFAAQKLVNTNNRAPYEGLKKCVKQSKH